MKSFKEVETEILDSIGNCIKGLIGCQDEKDFYLDTNHAIASIDDINPLDYRKFVKLSTDFCKSNKNFTLELAICLANGDNSKKHYLNICVEER